MKSPKTGLKPVSKNQNPVLKKCSINNSTSLLVMIFILLSSYLCYLVVFVSWLSLFLCLCYLAISFVCLSFCQMFCLVILLMFVCVSFFMLMFWLSFPPFQLSYHVICLGFNLLSVY